MRRFLSTTAPLASFIGKKPVYVPKQTTIDILCLPADQRRRVIKGRHSLLFDKIVQVKGPLGDLEQEIPEFMSLGVVTRGQSGNKNVTNDHESKNKFSIISDKTAEVDNVIVIHVANPKDKYQRMMWGTIRSIISNNIIGVNDGHIAILKLVGTGYKVTMQEANTANGEKVKVLHIKVGTSVPQILEIPENIKITIPVPTTVVVEGLDKQQIMLFASKIRNLHPPEPYKGKGVYLNDEKIKLKNKKIK